MLGFPYVVYHNFSRRYEENRFLLFIQETSSAVMFCNTLRSKFPSESVLSDCVFACETVEMVIIVPEQPCAASLTFHPCRCVEVNVKDFFFFLSL